MQKKTIRVRFAPSPTGPLHIGGVRTALYNYLFAKKHKGEFILRVEDTDQARYVAGAEEYIIESLQWLGINIDTGPGINDQEAGPYRQSERKSIYKKYALQLVESGHAYYAFDTSEELEAMRERMKKAGVASPKYDHVSREYMKNSLTLAEDDVKKNLETGLPYVIRMKMPRNEEIKVKDTVRSWVTVNSSQLDDKVLFKSDGMPTYHLANVVDDHLMNITHVIRGEEWLPSAPLHVRLYEAFGWEQPEFAHLPLILKPDGAGKLSKRDGDRLGFPVFPIEWKDPATGELSSGYREDGYEPEAVVNMLAMLGWHPGGSKEVFSLNELIQEFTLEKVGKSGAKFDPDKARWFNQQFVRHKDDHELAVRFMNILKEKNIQSEISYVEKVCALVKEKASFFKEFWELGSYFFIQPGHFDESVIKKKWNDQMPVFFTKLKDKLSILDSPDAKTIEVEFKTTATEMDMSPGAFMQLFRMILTGHSSGPALFEIAAVLGKSEVIERITAGLEKCN